MISLFLVLFSSLLWICELF